VTAIAAGSKATLAQTEQSSILLNLADTLGYGEFGACGGDITGRAARLCIDALAREGMRFRALEAGRWGPMVETRMVLWYALPPQT